MTKKNIKLKVKGLEVGFIKMQQEDFICITDITKHKNPDAPRDIIKNWMRSKNTIELLGLWEKLHNPDFKQVEFDLFGNEAGYNHFVLSPQKWISTTTAVTPKIAEQNDFFDIEFYRPRTITDDEKPEFQPESKSKQPELQHELKVLLEQGLEEEQQELQQELQQESLYGKVLGKLLQGALSTQEVSTALEQKSISGQLYTVINKLREDALIEWTIPDKPKSSKQQYKLTKRGLAFYALIKRRVRNEF